jgi:hypothetical protein
MSRGRTNISKILLPGLVFLLLCGIVAGEFPELLSLSDNTANDFTVRRTDSVVSPAFLGASTHVRKADINSSTCTPELHFSRVSPFEKAELIPSAAFTVHSVLRT